MINVLVADDERIARNIVVSLLAEQADIGIIYEARDGNEALSLARAHEPELVFLDIQMPGQTGLQLAEQLPASCAVIFVTAYNEFAVNAFELSAVDYLLKPFDDARFEKALDKARQRLTDNTLPDRQQLMALLASIAGEANRRFKSRLVVREPGRIRLIDVDKVNFIAGAGNYVEVHLFDGSHILHRETLTSLESQLDPADFVRIHRSSIVRKRSIRELRPGNKGDYDVLIEGGERLTLSRRYKDRLPEFFA